MPPTNRFTITVYGMSKPNNTFFGDGAVGNNGSPFWHYGVFRKSGGTASSGQTTFDNNSTFNNSGTVDIQTGSLAISRGTDSGVFNITNNSSVYFDINSAFTLTGSPTFTGTGFVYGNLFGGNAVIGGVLNFNYGYWGGIMTLASNTVVNLNPSIYKLLASIFQDIGSD